MKSPRMIPCLFVLAALASAPALAGGRDGSGVRGGGNVVDVNSTPYLMDLVTKAVCTFKSGSDLLDESPELAQVVELVSRLDWYFGFEIRRELSFLSFCFTGPLYRIADAGATDGAIPEPVESNVRQAAYRLRERIYVDSAIYRAMNAHNRAFLVLHEMLHSYLPMDLLDRKIMLRSLVKAFERVQKGEIRTRKALHFQLKSAGADFPRNTDLLDRYESQIRFLLTGAEERIAILRAEDDPERLIKANAEILAKNLARWDAAVLEANPPKTVLEGALGRAMIESDAAQFAELMRKPFPSIDAVGIALSILPEIEKENQDALFRSSAFRSFLAKGFAPVERATVAAGKFRIEANAALVRLTAEGATSKGPLPLTDLHGATVSPADLAWLANAIVYLVQNGRIDQVAAQITENPSFYSALGLKGAKRALDAMTAPIPREKPLALEVHAELKESLVRAFLAGLAARLTTEEYEAVETLIHRDRF